MADVSELLQLRQAADEANAKYERAKDAARRGGTVRLNELTHQIAALVKEAEALADALDMVFYYSTGYEQYNTMPKEDWSESSRDC